MNIRLCSMTKSMCREFFQGFTNDSDVFAEGQPFREYIYSEEKADAYWKKQQIPDRVYLAILLDDIPIGEVILKHIDFDRKCCTLSIHMKNDSVKNQGYGTQAERMAISYAAEVLNLQTIYADTLINNTRSQHVLEKSGFYKIDHDSTYCYFVCQV